MRPAGGSRQPGAAHRDRAGAGSSAAGGGCGHPRGTPWYITPLWSPVRASGCGHTPAVRAPGARPSPHARVARSAPCACTGRRCGGCVRAFAHPGTCTTSPPTPPNPVPTGNPRRARTQPPNKHQRNPCEQPRCAQLLPCAPPGCTATNTEKHAKVHRRSVHTHTRSSIPLSGACSGLGDISATRGCGCGRGCGGAHVMWPCNPTHKPRSPTSTLPSREHPSPGPLTPTQDGLGVLGRWHRVAAVSPGLREWGVWGVRGSSAAAHSTPRPSIAERAAGGSVTPGFIGIIIIIIIFIIILVEFPDTGSSGETAITEAALGFLFTYLFYSGGAFPDCSGQPWPGGRGAKRPRWLGIFLTCRHARPCFSPFPSPHKIGCQGGGPFTGPIGGTPACTPHCGLGREGWQV